MIQSDFFDHRPTLQKKNRKLEKVGGGAPSLVHSTLYRVQTLGR